MKKKEVQNEIAIEWFPAFKKNPTAVVPDPPMYRAPAKAVKSTKPAKAARAAEAPAPAEPVMGDVTVGEVTVGRVPVKHPPRLPRSAAFLLASGAVAAVWGVKAALRVPTRQRGTLRGYNSFVKAFADQRADYRERYRSDDPEDCRGRKGKRVKRRRKLGTVKKMKKMPTAPRVKAYKAPKKK